ncbi:MAG: alpha/beta hydrolase [Chloroflexi bacterium]|nr:alpha/beta hydrolase [Chloroflexota bacterium]
MIAVSSMYPDQATDYPPMVLIHGAANSAKVWTVWQQELAGRGWTSHAIDLRGHGQSPPSDLSRTTMEDYASDVRDLAGRLSQPPVVMGWSMGGLVGMMVASQGLGVACIALAPSLPARQMDTSVDLRTGEFGPEEYGIIDGDTNNQPTMPDLDAEERSLALSSLSRESRLARDQRRQGIIIESLPCPLLIVTGTDDKAWPKTRYEGLWLNAEFLEVEEASHWGLVLNRRALAVGIPEVLRWLTTNVGPVAETPNR